MALVGNAGRPAQFCARTGTLDRKMLDSSIDTAASAEMARLHLEAGGLIMFSFSGLAVSVWRSASTPSTHAFSDYGQAESSARDIVRLDNNIVEPFTSFFPAGRLNSLGL